jgi:hypothetical protein
MDTLILNAETASLSIEQLLKRAKEGGVEVRDTQGNILAFVLSPTDREAWTYAEANLDITQNLGDVRKALGRRGGITTSELLARAALAGKNAAQ